MLYRLIMEVRDNTRMEQFQRDFATLDAARRFARDQVHGVIEWQPREDGFDGLVPGYAFRIQAVQEERQLVS